MNILIVDDDLVDRKLIKKILHSSGLQLNEIVEVTSVTEGLLAVDKERFDLILLDYSMPCKGGIEMLREMRVKPSLGNTAIIMMSASEDPDIALECIEAGAQDFLPKEDINKRNLNKSIIYANKRFETDQRMHDSYLAVKHIAEKDQLTGLSNRHHFERLITAILANNQRSKSMVALLALDIDNFKNINDTLGHNIGDDILKQAVLRINSCLRRDEGFARLGGDEFAIIIGGVSDVYEVTVIANRILSQFLEPFILYDQAVNCTVSIGSAIYPNDAIEPYELLKCADIAMYRSKKNGKNKVSFYKNNYQDEFIRKVNIQNKVKYNLTNKLFHIHYQPLYCSNTKRIVGFEALVRWPNVEPKYTPDEFIPIAEECRLIDELGEWVITNSIEQLADWNNRYGLSLNLSINISPIQLQKKQLLIHLLKTTEKQNISPKNITLEITETAFIEDSNKVAKALSNLSEAGFKIALDDFGMGYSSISHLISYPIDIVKLDKSIQPENSTHDKRLKVIEGLSLMLKALDFKIVAEGIETEEQLILCNTLNIDCVQGFLLSKPLETKEVEKLFERIKN